MYETIGLIGMPCLCIFGYYRKPTHTDQYLNYYSNYPAKTKDAVVSALFKRAKDIISDKDDLEKENERIVKVLCDNCLLYTSPSPRDGLLSRMPSSA